MTDEKGPLPELTKKSKPAMSDQERYGAFKAERDNLTNAHHNPPKAPRILMYTDVERICKAAILQYRDNINRILEEQRNDSKPALKTNPDGSKEELISVQMHLKLERIEVTGKELIDRFKFNHKTVRPEQVINAYQLAMFKELYTKPLITKSGEEVEYEGSSKYFKTPEELTVKEMYEDKSNILIYHAFYPLASKGDTKAKALLELYQGLVSTMFAWGMNHQETVSKELTSKKIEEDRSIIEDKVKEFNEMVGFDPDKPEN